MGLPNFLIIGAAKSGTSSVFAYLGQHPEVFVSPVKEPNYFALADERVGLRRTGRHDRQPGVHHRFASLPRALSGRRGRAALGEASTLYLYAPNAAAAIRRDVPEARIIAILRDPAERAYSSFLHMRRDGRESVESFEESAGAGGDPDQRALGTPVALHRLGYYHAQLQIATCQLFPAHQIGVWLYDDSGGRAGAGVARGVHLPRRGFQPSSPTCPCGTRWRAAPRSEPRCTRSSPSRTP